jgi:hypothetical protein
MNVWPAVTEVQTHAESSMDTRMFLDVLQVGTPRSEQQWESDHLLDGDDAPPGSEELTHDLLPLAPSPCEVSLIWGRAPNPLARDHTRSRIPGGAPKLLRHRSQLAPKGRARRVSRSPKTRAVPTSGRLSQPPNVRQVQHPQHARTSDVQCRDVASGPTGDRLSDGGFPW